MCIKFQSKVTTMSKDINQLSVILTDPRIYVLIINFFQSISPGLVKSHFHAVQVGEEEAQHIYETKQVNLHLRRCPTIGTS